MTVLRPAISYIALLQYRERWWTVHSKVISAVLEAEQSQGRGKVVECLAMPIMTSSRFVMTTDSRGRIMQFILYWEYPQSIRYFRLKNDRKCRIWNEMRGALLSPESDLRLLSSGVELTCHAPKAIKTNIVNSAKFWTLALVDSTPAKQI